MVCGRHPNPAIREQRTLAKAKPKPKIEVPTAAQDRLPVGRVGIIAGAGFVFGIVWPWMAGVQLVPKPPSEEISAAPAPTSSSKKAKPPAASKTSPNAEEPAAEDRVQVGAALILGCRDKGDKRVAKCDTIEFDAVAKPRLKTLANCAGAKLATGVLSIGFELDFKTEKITKIQRGKSTSVADDASVALVECAKKEFATASLSGIDHKYPNYTIFYKAQFFPPGAAPKPADGNEGDAGAGDTKASGFAVVSWNVALVRDQPKKEGKLLARVLQGTRVGVVAKQNDWVRVKYDAKGNEGWVFRTAIGL